MSKHCNRFITSRLLHTLMLLTGLWVSGFVFAQDVQQLIRSNNLELKAWVGEEPSTGGESSPPNFSVNEQVILTIEVATARWFTGGTRIGTVEIPNVIAKQRNQLATNFTDRKGEQTWSRQRWEVTLYPQKSGRFVIPPVAVEVEVSAPDRSNVAGTLYTRPIEFTASLPSGLLSDETPWFTASSVDVNQEWQLSGEPLRAGDAVTRKITITAQDSLSVLLPELMKGEANARYQVYPQPNQLTDTQTRGDYQSTRTEETVYVIQQGGALVLPEYEFRWWNSKAQQLESVLVEGKSFDAKHTVKSFINVNLGWLIGLVVALVLGIIVVTAVKRYYRNKPIPAWLALHRLLKAKRWGAARALLYKQARINTSELEIRNVDPSDSWQKSSTRLQRGEHSARLIKSMWRKIQTKKKHLSFRIPRALPQLDKFNRKDGVE